MLTLSNANNVWLLLLGPSIDRTTPTSTRRPPRRGRPRLPTPTHQPLHTGSGTFYSIENVNRRKISAQFWKYLSHSHLSWGDFSLNMFCKLSKPGFANDVSRQWSWCFCWTRHQIFDHVNMELPKILGCFANTVPVFNLKISESGPLLMVTIDKNVVISSNEKIQIPPPMSSSFMFINNSTNISLHVYNDSTLF